MDKHVEGIRLMGLASTGKCQRGRIKCVVWDLDETLWRGVLLEDPAVTLLPEAEAVIRALDARGILQSLASKNDHDFALAKLEELGLSEFFLYPHVNWGPKSASVESIAKRLNIGIDSIAFVDDQPFERDEVAHRLPSVLTIDSARIGDLLAMEEFIPRTITDETRARRRMYMADAARHRAEESFEGASEDFLRSLQMVFTISRADARDLDRIEELVARTNQLNTTGQIYSLDELAFFRESPDHELWVASLSDRYGDYGKIGVALLAKSDGILTISAFLMSCRVMTRGVGSVFLGWIVNRADKHGLRLQAKWRQTDRNRMMLVTYRFLGFVPIASSGDFELLEYRGRAMDFPDFVQMRAPEPDADGRPGSDDIALPAASARGRT